MNLTLTYADEANELDRFLELACLTYGGDHEQRRVEARRLLTEYPTFSEQNLFSIACCGNVDLLKRKLESGEITTEEFNTPGGPMAWEPLLYACYSRVEMPGGSTLAVAKLLLENGAHPNAHYMWGGQYKFTALTGVFGEGESGPKQQPPHSEFESLAKLLLEAGADPNDSQALYNRMFTPGSRCLEMLLEYGLSPAAKNNWMNQEAGKLVPNEDLTLVYQLRWAIDKQHHDRVKMILDAGIDVNHQSPTEENQNSFLKAAMLAGNTTAAQLLIDAGAEQPQLSTSEQFVAAVNSGDTEAAKALLQQAGNDADELRSRLPDLLMGAAGSNRIPVAKCALDLGVDVNVMLNATALHQAAWHGHGEMKEFLLAAGADPTLRDPKHNATPDDWARHSGNA